MKFIFCILFESICLAGFAQKARSVLINLGVRPVEINTAQDLMERGIRAEAIYHYKNKKNKDSTLVVVNFFDSLGYCIKKEEFNDNGSQPFRITNYSYTNNVLTNEEINDANSVVSHTIVTFDYDSAGHKIAERHYGNFSLTKITSQLSLLEQFKWQYDSLGRIEKEFSGGISGNVYLYGKYFYVNNRLQEINIFDTTGKWLYAYVYDYNDLENKKAEFTQNKYLKSLDWEKYYNNQNLLIKETYDSNALNEFQYDGNLVTVEKERNNFLEINYFKHYYFLTQW